MLTEYMAMPNTVNELSSIDIIYFTDIPAAILSPKHILSKLKIIFLLTINFFTYKNVKFELIFIYFLYEVKSTYFCLT